MPTCLCDNRAVLGAQCPSCGGEIISVTIPQVTLEKPKPNKTREMIVAKLKLNMIDKSGIFDGQKHKFIDIKFWENKDGQRDQYGWDGSIQQDLGRARRDAGEKEPYIGNWKDTARNPQSAPRQQSAPAQHTGGFHDDSDIPFAPFEKACRVPL